MALRKTTIDNSANYIAQSGQTRERDSKPNTLKKTSLHEKQNEKTSQNNIKIIKDFVTGEGFKIFKWTTSGYF